MSGTLLTIDWDVFLPEFAGLDLGHKEAELFLTFLWLTRYHHRDHLTLNGEQVLFWHWMRRSAPLPSDLKEVYVSDSHALVWPLLCEHDPDTVILIDQHHDLFPASDDSGHQIYCHDWALHWLEQDYERRLIWFAPDYLDNPRVLNEREVPRQFRDRVKMLMWPDDLVQSWVQAEFAQVGVAHICRSGCWSPPWHDYDFIQFVGQSGLRPEVLLPENHPNREVWNPMVPRWGPEEEAQARALSANLAPGCKI